MERPLEILVKYFDPNMPRLEKLEQGNWIDLRCIDDIHLLAGIRTIIPLGVAMKLPYNYEAIVLPRSSSFKNWGVLQVNSMGVIDNSYCGDNDQWFWGVYPTKDATIEKYSRVCQFRIQLVQPKVYFTEVFALGVKDRGGHGSTGVK